MLGIKYKSAWNAYDLEMKMIIGEIKKKQVGRKEGKEQDIR